MTNLFALLCVGVILYFVIKFFIDYWFIVIPLTVLITSVIYFSSNKGEKKLKKWEENRLLRKAKKEENKLQKERDKEETIKRLKREKIESQFNVDSIKSKIENTKDKIERLSNMKNMSNSVDKSNTTKLVEFENKYKLLIHYFEEYYQRYNCIYIKAILNIELQNLKKIEASESEYDFVEFKNEVINKLKSVKIEVNSNLNKYNLKNNNSIDNEIIVAKRKLDDIIVAYLNIETNKLIKDTSPIMENEFLKKLLSIEKEASTTENEFFSLNSEFDRLCAEIEISGKNC